MNWFRRKPEPVEEPPEPTGLDKSLDLLAAELKRAQLVFDVRERRNGTK